ncbi:hypothetical protein WJ95_27045 [Burkholderia ubonensis]|uniref:Lipoprotein n=1 Tax=Burkholderia ubonensis TaxID=101571 RepID=A0A118CYL8_9BURK|nr:hypothetical protein [Burkholderia ubonensis]AJX14330.1 putative membrane protein [Burkholderia ubonensis MSMB22]KVC85634.1 hypothetical protein WI76_06265 [Burkholderia ubonensis]KVC93510.1 hypothetical protein WI77_01880 [Burkholderia ubonensis]KVD05858.1 hypothetical protein WI79_11915 [Burkholderia ubonensis]KVD07761.1 hypothetical protein WI80_17295 [Burkholderia ubonensis]
MKLVLFLHLVFVAAWMSCVIVEGIFEHAIDRSPEQRSFISNLHWATDKYVEIPAFTIVLVTGAILLAHRTPTPLLLTKVAFGTLAIALNAVCVWIVVRRRHYAARDDHAAWERIDRVQHKLGGIVAIAMLAALGIGGYMFAGA